MYGSNYGLMWVDLSLSSGEGRLVSEFADAITSSLELHTALALALPILQRLVSADAAALGVSKPGSLDDYDWLTHDLPKEFLAGYPEMTPHDFVRRSVVERPNIVVCDIDMISRNELERNMMYVRARECGAGLEQVMATMLCTDQEWTSGISLYRTKRIPFGERDQRLFQLLAPIIANAVTNARQMALARSVGRGLATALNAAELAVIVVDSRARELDRTAAAATLIAKWFPGQFDTTSALPGDILSHFLQHSELGQVPPRIVLPGTSSRLKIGFFRTAGDWGIILREELDAPRIPFDFSQRLTSREHQVCSLLLQQKSDGEIAKALRIAPGTVKVHARNAYRRLGLDGWAHFVARVGDLVPPFDRVQLPKESQAIRNKVKRRTYRGRGTR